MEVGHSDVVNILARLTDGSHGFLFADLSTHDC